MGNQKREKQFMSYQKVPVFCRLLLIIFIIWTGILLWSGTKQYLLSGRLEKKVATLLVMQGGTKAAELEKVSQEQGITFWMKKALAQTGSLSYLVANRSKLPKQEEDIDRIAALFVGKNAGKTIWSSAAGKKSIENELFKKKEQIAEVSVVPTQSIILFQNGSPDITSKNKSEVSKPTMTQSIICDDKEKLQQNLSMIEQLKRGLSRSYLLRKFYITDSSTSIDNEVFQVEKLLTMNLRLKKENKPQILIFHTHGASEAFVDSRSGKKEDSIVGVGEKLAEILSKKYGYQVLHDKTEYDKINGRIDRNKAYNNAYNGLQKTLKKYPSIQVIIDLHRDGVGNAVKRTTTIGGKRTAQVMFFNGLSRSASGDIAYLHNENLQGNLAFSLQLKMACMKRFENFAKPVYLKSYRYNMHLRKRFTLIELGNENNTVQEAKNAMEPLAMVIDAVLTGQ